jgi:hypothetical protein
MKKHVTIWIDEDLKNRVFEIIHYEKRESFSSWVNEQLKIFLEKNKNEDSINEKK